MTSINSIFPNSPTWLNWATVVVALAATMLTCVVMTNPSVKFVEGLIPCIGFSFGAAMILGFVHAHFEAKARLKDENQP